MQTEYNWLIVCFAQATFNLRQKNIISYLRKILLQDYTGIKSSIRIKVIEISKKYSWGSHGDWEKKIDYTIHVIKKDQVK